ncbi:hypothetical protein [Spirosoma pollinicola]|uniref:Uncharacterized protein n=1 Tax=Spirosoma pollinicola TaxID=2057025 RepID=A0A2K8Z2Y4_9BACT|nr:hypothetical protein [Spirosoma pollinicola]AUD04227.1 hypothetical protein CWM47_21725 [Spirosoma pollinicola]
MKTKSLTQQAVYQFLNELYQIDQTLSGNYNPNQDEDVNLTGLGELVLDKFTIEVNDPQENDVFERSAAAVGLSVE